MVFTGLITQLVFIRELTNSISGLEFSLYIYIFQLVSLLNVLQIGLDYSVSRDIAIHLGSERLQKANESFGVIRLFNNKLFFVGFLSVIIISSLFYYGNGLNGDYDYEKGSKLFLIFGFSILINFLGSPFTVAMIGNNQQAKVNLNNTLISLATSLFAFCILKCTHIGIYSMPLSLVLFNAYNFYRLKKMALLNCTRWLNPDAVKSVAFKNYKGLFQFAIYASIGGVAWTIEATSDVFILNGLGQLTYVGIYAVWWKFPQMSFDIITRLSSSSLPIISGSITTSKEVAHKMFNSITLLAGGMGFVALIYLSTLLPSLVSLWVGRQFLVSEFSLITYFLGFLVYGRILGNSLGNFVNISGMVSFSAKLSWLQAIVKVVLSLYLSVDMGLKGLLIASIISSLIQVFVFSIVLLKMEVLRTNTIQTMCCGYIISFLLLTFDFPVTNSTGNFILYSLLSLVVSVFLWLVLMFFFNKIELTNWSKYLKTRINYNAKHILRT